VPGDALAPLAFGAVPEVELSARAGTAPAKGVLPVSGSITAVCEACRKVRISPLRRKMVRGGPSSASMRSMCSSCPQACQMREPLAAPPSVTTTKVPV